MSGKPTITCAENGPLLARGLETLVRIGDERAYETQDVTALCRCGASANKPYCDGSHARVGFTGAKHPERVPDRREDHQGQALTIHDNRGICAHAGFCTDALPSVFRLRQEPWIDPDGAPAEDVVAAVRRCPSGALSHSRDGVEHRDQERPPRVLVAPRGPYAVQGGVVLEGVEWGEGASREHYDLCRCGQSRNKPFCSGAHWDADFDEDA